MLDAHSKSHSNYIRIATQLVRGRDRGSYLYGLKTQSFTYVGDLVQHMLVSRGEVYTEVFNRNST